MSLLSKIVVALVFLAAVPFSYLAARTLRTHAGWRSEHAKLTDQIADEEKKYLAATQGIIKNDDGTKQASEKPGKLQLKAELASVRNQRGKVWRRCIVNQVDDQGKVTLTIEFPRPHAIKPADVGHRRLFAFDQNVYEIGEADIEEDDELDEEADDEPVDDEEAPDEDGEEPVDEEPADEEPAEEEPAEDAPAADDAAALIQSRTAVVCQDPPAEGEAPAEEGDAEGEGEGEAEEGDGEEEEEEEEEEVEEEPAFDDSNQEYEIENFMGEFQLTAVAGNMITLELREQATPERIQKLKDSTGTWILLDTMTVDDPDAYAFWDEDKQKEHLPAGVVEELALRGQELKPGESAPFYWVEVKFLKNHSVNLRELVADERTALKAKALAQLEQDMLALGKSPEEIAKAKEERDIQIEGLRPLIDPDYESESKGDDDDEEEARPGIPIPKARKNTAKVDPILVRFKKGDTMMFDPITAAKLTGETFKTVPLIKPIEKPIPLEPEEGEAADPEDAGQEPDADAEEEPAAADAVAEVVRRVRRWRHRNYTRLFHFATANEANLLDLIARETFDRDLSVIGDAVVTEDGIRFDNVTGGALFEKRAAKASAQFKRDIHQADLDLFTYDYQVVKAYHAKVAARHAAILAHRKALLAQVDALAKRLAAVRIEQRRRIEARSASSSTAIKP